MTTRLAVEQAKLGDLRPYPGNARRGDVDAIAESLRVNGQFRPLIVQRSTGYVLAGNHTLQAAQKLGWPSVQITYLDVDDEQARRIVVADNRTADLGEYDDRALLDLLRSFDDDLAGTGYSTDDFDDLLAQLQEMDADNPPQEPTALVPYATSSGAYGADGDGTNTRQTPSYAEYQAAYDQRATRFLALIYPLGQYAWIVGKMGQLADDRGLESNSAVLLALVAEAVGEVPPAEDAPVTAEVVAAADAVEATAEEPTG